MTKDAYIRLKDNKGNIIEKLSFKAARPIIKVKTIIGKWGFMPANITERELIKGVKFIDLNYTDNSALNYDRQMFYKAFSKLK